VLRRSIEIAGKGGLSLTKWGDTKSKIDPVIDKLLAGYEVDPNGRTPVVPPRANPDDEMSQYDDLFRLNELRERGALTQEEFDAEKAKILSE